MEIFYNIHQGLLYIIGFGLAFIITLFMTPYSKKIALKIGAIDQPKDRGVHVTPMPLAGGIAIVLGFVVSISILAPQAEGFNLEQFIGFISGALIITIVGLLDDIYNLSPRIRIFFQVLASLIVVLSGTTIGVLTWPWALGGAIIFEDIFAKVVTMFWIIGITNAVNFIDGLDGLATGISAIASLCLMLISILYGPPIAVLLTATLAGSCMGFLPHNFNPAKIFMGDTGSTFLGFSLAVISIQGLIKSYTAITIIIAITILGLPIFDTSFAILRRIAKGQSPAQGDRGHLHHRMIDKGYSHRRAVLTLYGIGGGFGIAGVLVAMNDFVFAIIVVLFMVTIWIIDTIMMRRKYRINSLKKDVKKEDEEGTN